MRNGLSMRMIAYLAVVMLAASTSSMAQDDSDAVRPFYGNGGPGGSRAEGLAQAFTAIADDGSALYFNPAGLANQTNTEFNFGLNHLVAGTESGNNSNSISATRLGNLFIVLPGENSKWTVALGYHSVRAFERTRTLSTIITINDIFDTATLTETVVEEGQLSSAVAGVGYQISPQLSLGATVNLQYGANIYDDTEKMVTSGIVGPITEVSSLHIEPTYWGVGVSLGVLAAPLPNLRFGFLIKSPLSMTVNEDSYDDVDPETFSVTYKTRQGFSMRAGTALNVGPLLLSADLFWEDYSQVRFESDIYDDDLPIDAQINDSLRTNYSSALGFALGGELLVPFVNTKVRGGYRYRPALKTGTYEESATKTVTGGVSLLVTGGLKLDVTYSYSFWERELSQSSIFWQSGVSPLRSTVGTLRANLIMRL